MNVSTISRGERENYVGLMVRKRNHQWSSTDSDESVISSNARKKRHSDPRATLQTDVDNFPNEHRLCFNCHRRHLPLQFTEGNLHLKKQFSSLDKNMYDEYNMALLCEDCKDYLENKREVKRSSGWPAFVWRLLTDSNENVRHTTWKILPKKWREWWEEDVRSIMNDSVMNTTPTITVDVTFDYEKFRRLMTIENMKHTSWPEFLMCIESCMTIPNIRCPWGCSEYIRQPGLLPLDVVLQSLVNRNIPTYTKNVPAERYGFRKDWLDTLCILYHKWAIRPSLCIIHGEPFVLCCRYHSKSDTHKYIHPPRNPTGAVAFHADHGLAQIAAVPRTVKMFKRKEFSNSYELRKITGNFTGIDSINLTSHPNYSRNENVVTKVRDKLVMLGRPECVNRRDEFGFPFKSDQEIKDLISTFSSHKFQRLVYEYGRGATFVPLKNIFEIYNHLKQDTAEIIQVEKRKPNQQPYMETVSYVPVWTQHQFSVQPYNDDLGDPFVCYKAGISRGKKKRPLTLVQAQVMFFIVNPILMIPELWKAVHDSIKTNLTWHGWMLHFIALQVIKGTRRVRIKNTHPFYIGNKASLLTALLKHVPFLDTTVDNPGTFLPLYTKTASVMFSSIQGVCVIKSDDLDLHNYSEYNIIALLYNIDACTNEHAIDVHASFPGYPLRMFATYEATDETCYIFVRNETSRRFWQYKRSNKGVCWEGLQHINEDDLKTAHHRNWVFAIFVRSFTPEFRAMKTQLFELLGGQTFIRCIRHSHPLIPSPTDSGLPCVHFGCSEPNCNSKKLDLICPIQTCSVGICKDCIKNYKTTASTSCPVYVGVSINEYSVSSDTEYNLMEEVYDSDSTDIEMNNYETQNKTEYTEMMCDDDEQQESDTLYDPEDDTDVCLQDEIGDYDSVNISLEHKTENEDDVSNHDDSSEDTKGGMLDAEEFPVTHAGNVPMKFNTWKLAQQGRLIPNHILLNCHGNLLLRRHKQIKPMRAAKSFLLRLASCTNEKNMPLLYPEASIYPSLFWIGNNDGSIAGSIPACALMDDKTLNTMGLASLYDHCRTRLIDPSLLSSTDQSYMGYMWDQVANLGLRGSNTKTVLRRGFADYIKQGGLLPNTEDPKLYDSHHIDCRKTVNQLAAVGARKKNDLFFTWTMNGKETPGVQIITNWLRSEEFMDIYENEHASATEYARWSWDERKDIQKQIEESACIFIIRAWMEFVELFLYYLQYGKDSPFVQAGIHIDHIWNRSEIQSDQDGKAPHQHTLIYLKNPPTTEEDLQKVLNLIRGSKETFFPLHEAEDLARRHLIPTADFATDLLESVSEKLTHYCTKRCQIIKTTTLDDGTQSKQTERKCKAPDNRRLNPNATIGGFVEIPIQHSQQALQVMLDLGMIKQQYYRNSDRLLFTPTDEYQSVLVAKRYCPPCYATDCVFSPANPTLFVMLRSAMNLQYVTSYILARYLTKYCAQVDKSNKLSLKVHPTEKDQVDVIPDEGYNSKIASNNLGQKQKDGKEKNEYTIEARTLSMAELAMQFLQYPTIRTSYKFEYIPTQPMGLRPAIVRGKSYYDTWKGKCLGIPDNAETVHDIDIRQVNTGYRVRHDKQFGPSRQFDKYQQITFADGMFSNVFLDKVTIFSLRPPELRFVRRLPHYLTWFTRKIIPQWTTMDPEARASKLNKILQSNQLRSPWVDGMGYIVQVKRPAISKICKLLQSYDTRYIQQDFKSQAQYKSMRHLFQCLSSCLKESCSTHDTSEHVLNFKDMKSCFISQDTAEDLPVYWWRTVRATDTEVFLYHLLLSMGQFGTEIELYSQGSMKAAFIYARLLSDSDSTEEFAVSINQLTKRFIDDQLMHYPISSHSFDREIVETSNLLHDFFINDTIKSPSMPSALFTQIRQQCDIAVETEYNLSREKLIESFIYHLHPFFSDIIPQKSSILGATFHAPIPFSLTKLPKTEHQDDMSYKEHQIGYDLLEKAVAHYKDGSDVRTKSLVILGGGGVGKTVDLRLAGMYCICQGLSVMMTTLTGKRGAETAGSHIHHRFAIEENESWSPIQIADKAYLNLLKDPLKYIALARTDVLLIDELGQVSAELFEIMNIILSKIRHSTQWFGGILVIATMDIKQLRPINGLPPIFSPVMMSSFLYILLQIPLRTFDANLRRIQTITRMPPKELVKEGIEEEFKRLITTSCTFIKSINDPILRPLTDCVYCFPKHETCINIETQILNKAKKLHPNYTSKFALDYEQARTQVNPVEASPYSKRFLDKKSGLSRELVFYPFAPFQICNNDKKGNYFHGQLCMLLDEIPLQNNLDEWKKFVMFRAPHGIDSLPNLPITKDELISQGWEPITISKQNPKKLNIGVDGLVASRQQYNLKHRICVTIHAIMGSTVSSLITEINEKTSTGLWEAAMTVVILSRTRTAKDIHFIGNPTDTSTALWNALLQGGKYYEMSQLILDCITKQIQATNSHDTFFIHPRTCHYQSIQNIYPPVGEWTVYLICSINHPNDTYTGHSKNPQKRLTEHNSTFGGSLGTGAEHRRKAPWALLALVVGFNTEYEADSFEGIWKKRIQMAQMNARGQTTAQSKCNIASAIIYANGWNHLNIMHFGTVTESYNH